MWAPARLGRGPLAFVDIDNLKAVGIYQIGYKFSDLLAFMAPAFLGAVLPLMIRAWPDRIPEFRSTFRQAFIIFVAFGVFAAVTFAAWTVRKRAPYVLVGWLWFVGTLVPVIGIVQIGAASMADRYTYFPSIGLFIAIVWGAADILTARVAAIAGAIVTADPRVAEQARLLRAYGWREHYISELHSTVSRPHLKDQRQVARHPVCNRRRLQPPTGQTAGDFQRFGGWAWQKVVRELEDLVLAATGKQLRDDFLGELGT